MRMIRAIAIVSLCAAQVAAAEAGALLPPGFGSGVTAAAIRTRADEAQGAPAQFLPWPPPVPGPVPSGTPPVAPSVDPTDPRALAATLEQVLAAVQNVMDRLRQWFELMRQTAAGALTQIVIPLPIALPTGAGPVDVLAELAALPERWRAIAAAALAKLRMANPANDAVTRHEADIADSSELSHEAGTIASADQQVISSAMQHEVAIAATAAVADAAVQDTALPAAADAARAAGDQLAAAAQNLPSSRAGIELLVAGMGGGLRHQAALTVALADRITGFIQQAAQLSAQIGALASTIGVLTERDLERDRNTLDARLGIADVARGGGTLLRQFLERAGEPADEIRLVPLY
jgi:hypothetical protein